MSLAADLVAAGRGNVEMVVECAATMFEAGGGVPQLIDVVLVGQHPKGRQLSLQLVELKRWSTVTRVEKATADWVYVPGMDEKRHPALQLRDYYEAFTGTKGPLYKLDFECGGFSYLHNATDASVRPLLDVDAPTGAYAQLYTKDRRGDLLTDLRRSFAADGADVAVEQLLRSMGVRNTPLLDAMIWSRGDDTVFTLRGRQKEVADQIMDTVSKVLPDPGIQLLCPTSGAWSFW